MKGLDSAPQGPRALVLKLVKELQVYVEWPI
jgi:hypothetical protein